MNLFYDPEIGHNKLYLNEDESFHCIKVLRLKEGTNIHVTNGRGDLFETVIDKIEKKKVSIQIINTISEYGSKDYLVHIALAPTKNIDRFEWFLEKATEIGIDEITPLICYHSERNVIKPERQEKVIVAALKQSLKAYKPKLNEVIKFKDFITKERSGHHKFIALCEADERKPLKEVCIPDSKYLILIGPEGDFSKEELLLAREAGFNPVSLGSQRLRTETAGVLACHICNLVNDPQ